jgi:hypothetical protein
MALRLAKQIGSEILIKRSGAKVCSSLLIDALLEVLTARRKKSFPKEAFLVF